MMPQWAGSCWYELRYLDPTNENRFVDPAVERYWMGPSGRRRRRRRRPVRRRRRARRAAPAVRPLLAQGAVRPGLGVVRGAVPPPVQPGLHPGLRLHRRAGACTCRPRRSASSDGAWTWNGEPVDREFGKMGKSLKNSVTPDELYDAYGADTMRLYEMSMGPLEQSRPVGDPGRRRHVPVPAAGLAQPGRRGDRRAAGGRRAAPTTRPAGCCTAPSPPCAPTWTGLRFNTAIAKLIELNNHLVGAATVPAGGGRAAGADAGAADARTSPRSCGRGWATTGRWPTRRSPSADPALLVDDTAGVPGAGQRQGPGPRGRGHGGRRRHGGGGRPGRPQGGGGRSAARRPSGSWSCPAGSSTSSASASAVVSTCDAVSRSAAEAATRPSCR